MTDSTRKILRGLSLAGFLLAGRGSTIVARWKFNGPHVWGTGRISGRMLKKFDQQGRTERRGDAYSVRYVELLSKARTLLAYFFSILLVGWLASQLTHMSEMNAWAGSQSSNKRTKAQGDAERGRTVFNGKGVCYYCHGIDGNKDQRPQLAADTAALIAQLNPPPVNLRNPKALYLKADKQRAHAIREGHPGTGMFPDTRMTTQELTDTLAYLALLRGEGALTKP
jgi:cytochrome c553